jgi:hypothetical protein
MRSVLPATLLLFTTLSVQALSLDQLSDKEAVAGLKEALGKGAGQAVNKLGKLNGFLGNERVKIPLPESLNKADHTLRRFGMGKYADELVVTMNRAAEQAVPEARTLLIDAVKTMSIDDAKQILSGGDTSATDYFRRKTSAPLTAKFRPIVVKATSRLQLAQSYNRFAGKASRLGLIDKEQANIDDYVTQKALDGLFLMIADEEKAIRANPVKQGSKLLRDVFGALLN